jgi:hypothetical protein
MDERSVSVDKVQEFESVQNVEFAEADCASIFQQTKEFWNCASFVMYLIYTSAIKTEHIREVAAEKNQ